VENISELSKQKVEKNELEEKYQKKKAERLKLQNSVLSEFAHKKESAAALKNDLASISFEDLLKGVNDQVSMGGVQKQLQTLSEMEAVDTGVGEVKAARIARELNYDKTTHDMKKWAFQINRTRQQKTVVYGDYENLLSMRNTKGLNSEFKFQTGGAGVSDKNDKSQDKKTGNKNAEDGLNFEAMLESAVKESGVLDEQIKEQNQLDSITADELKSSQVRDLQTKNQIAHLRALMLREHARAKRLKKIKSKTYRKMTRKTEAKEKEKLMKRY